MDIFEVLTWTFHYVKMLIDMNKQAIKEILEKIKQESFVSGYKATDEEAMGLLVSKYFEWDGLNILKVTYNALEDANFHTDNKKIREMIDILEK
jgi:hypothetical protein